MVKAVLFCFLFFSFYKFYYCNGMSKTILEFFYMYIRVVKEISKCIYVIGHRGLTMEEKA